MKVSSAFTTILISFEGKKSEWAISPIAFDSNEEGKVNFYYVHFQEKITFPFWNGYES